jgi:hypothetical protein
MELKTSLDKGLFKRIRELQKIANINNMEIKTLYVPELLKSEDIIGIHCKNRRMDDDEKLSKIKEILE